MTSTPVPAIPTTQSLGISPPKDIDPNKIAGEWLEKFQTAVLPSPNGGVDVDKILGLFQPDAFWRDILSLTWVSRTGIFHVLFALFFLTFTNTILQT